MQYVDEEALQPMLQAAWMLCGGTMLRVEMQNSTNTVRLKFEGRFIGDDAQNTRTLLTNCRDEMTLLVDLTEVTFIDSVGEEALSLFGRFGAEFVAETSYALDVCERLHLRLARSGALDPSPSGASRPNARRHKQSKNS
jgi:hypothetical protein